MDFTKIGLITNYAKTMKRKYDWNKKKKENDFQSQSKKTELERKNDIFKADYKRMQQNNNEDKTLKSIHSKVSAGANLTYSEMRYLQQKDPALYHQLKAREIELNNYERDLKHCKTKEEVERLQMSKLSEALIRIKANKGAAQEELKKLEEFKKIDAKFAKNGEFSKLPTENEVHQAEKQESEQRKAEIEKLYEEVKKYANTDTENNAVSESEFASHKETFEGENSSKVYGEDIPAEAEIKNSDAQKVKRAKAKAAYIETEKSFKAASAIYVTENPFRGEYNRRNTL